MIGQIDDNKPKLSIIVPIYNVEEYLPRCVESIQHQTVEDFELFLIDDGSPDKCPDIIDAYAGKDSRIVTIHQANQGVSTARNAGLRIAKGKYIGFVDPDDWIEPDMYETLIQAMEEQDCDIVSCSWFDNEPDGAEKAFLSGLQTQFMEGEAYMRHLFDMPPTLAGSACFKLFRRERIGHFFDNRFAICEDNLFVAQYCAGVRRAFYLNRPLYHVFQRENSATRANHGKTAYCLPARREMIDIAQAVSKECGVLAERVFLDQCIHFCTSGTDSGTEYRDYAIKEYTDYCKNHPGAVLWNTELSAKQKAYFIWMYVKLRAARMKMKQKRNLC